MWLRGHGAGPRPTSPGLVRAAAPDAARRAAQLAAPTAPSCWQPPAASGAAATRAAHQPPAAALPVAGQPQAAALPASRPVSPGAHGCCAAHGVQWPLWSETTAPQAPGGPAVSPERKLPPVPRQPPLQTWLLPSKPPKPRTVQGLRLSLLGPGDPGPRKKSALTPHAGAVPLAPGPSGRLGGPSLPFDATGPGHVPRQRSGEASGWERLTHSGTAPPPALRTLRLLEGTQGGLRDGHAPLPPSRPGPWPATARGLGSKGSSSGLSAPRPHTPCPSCPEPG